MSYKVFFVVLFLGTATMTEGYPGYVQCDFTVRSGKASTGTNVMTTTSGKIMGNAPLESYNLVSSATWSFAGEEVQLSYGGGIKSKGFIHVSSGSLAGANKCANSRYEWSSTPSGRITWTAPSDETASVTISVATAGGYGRISRQRITLTKIEAPTTQAPTPALTTRTEAPTTQTQVQNCMLGNCCGTGTKWNGKKCVPSYHDIMESCSWNNGESEWSCKTECQ